MVWRAAVVFAVVSCPGGMASANALYSTGEVIDQIVVVAHKDERSIREIAANVTVLSRSELSNTLSTSMADLFRYVPGIDYEAAGTRFGTEGINIRGIGGNRVTILVDSVPLADQFGTGSFSNATRDFIDAGLIQDIEVLHGPASALYGSSAIGGVVSVRTPDPSDLLRNTSPGGDFLLTWRGADNSQHGQVMVAAASDSFGAMAGLSWRDGEESHTSAGPSGVDTKAYQRSTAILKFVMDNRWGQTLRATYTWQSSDTVSALNSVLGSGRYRSTTALEGDDESRLDSLNLSWEFGSQDSILDSGIVRAYLQYAQVTQATPR